MVKIIFIGKPNWSLHLGLNLKSLHLLFTAEKIVVSSVQSKSLKTESCGTPAVALAQNECRPFTTTCYFWQEKKDLKDFKKF